MSVFTCSNPGSLWYGFSFSNDWIDINILDKLWAGLQAGPDQVLKIKDKKKIDIGQQIFSLKLLKFLIHQFKHLFWVLKRTVSLRGFF